MYPQASEGGHSRPRCLTTTKHLAVAFNRKAARQACFLPASWLWPGSTIFNKLPNLLRCWQVKLCRRGLKQPLVVADCRAGHTKADHAPRYSQTLYPHPDASAKFSPNLTHHNLPGFVEITELHTSHQNPHNARPHYKKQYKLSAPCSVSYHILLPASKKFTWAGMQILLNFIAILINYSGLAFLQGNIV